MLLAKLLPEFTADCMPSYVSFVGNGQCNAQRDRGKKPLTAIAALARLDCDYLSATMLKAVSWTN